MEDEIFAHYRDTLHVRIWSGFENESSIAELLEDWRLDGEATPYLAQLKLVAEHEMATKRAAEATWPKETDCDRLDAAFDRLEKAGILALQDAGYTTSDAHSDAWDLIGQAPNGRYKGFCYYHGQDVERVVAGMPLWLGFDAVADGEAAKRAVGTQVCDALKAVFTVEWNGDPETRIELSGITWKRRTKWLNKPAEKRAGLIRRLFGLG